MSEYTRYKYGEVQVRTDRIASAAARNNNGNPNYICTIPYISPDGYLYFHEKYTNPNRTRPNLTDHTHPGNFEVNAYAPLAVPLARVFLNAFVKNNLAEYQTTDEYKQLTKDITQLQLKGNSKKPSDTLPEFTNQIVRIAERHIENINRYSGCLDDKGKVKADNMIVRLQDFKNKVISGEFDLTPFFNLRKTTHSKHSNLANC